MASDIILCVDDDTTVLSALRYSLVLHRAEIACREAEVSLSLMAVMMGEGIAAQVRRHEAEALVAVGFFENEALSAVRACELPLVLADHFHSGLCCINMDKS